MRDDRRWATIEEYIYCISYVYRLSNQRANQIAKESNPISNLNGVPILSSSSSCQAASFYWSNTVDVVTPCTVHCALVHSTFNTIQMLLHVTILSMIHFCSGCIQFLHHFFIQWTFSHSCWFRAVPKCVNCLRMDSGSRWYALRWHGVLWKWELHFLLCRYFLFSPI